MSTLATPAPTHAVEQLIVFKLAERDYALPVADVVEILRMVAVAPVPSAPAWLPGVIDLRGSVVPVADLRSRLGMEPVPPRLDTPILVARRGERLIGLIADGVSDLLDVPADSIEPAADIAGPDTPLKAVARTGERLLMLLDLDRLAGDVEQLA